MKKELEVKEKKKNILIGVLIAIIIILIGLCVYLAFIKKDSVVEKKSETKTVDNDENNSVEYQKFEKLERIELSKISKGIIVDEKIFDLEMKNQKLYINSKEVDADYAYVAFDPRSEDYYMILTSGASQIGEVIVGYVDDKMNFVEENDWYVINKLYFGDYNYIYAKKFACDVGLDTCDNWSDIELVYENGKFNIYELVPRYEIDDNNNPLSVVFNNKEIKFKIQDDNLYLNNKKIEAKEEFIDIPNVIYVTEKFILIASNGGQCDGDVILGAVNENNEYIDVDINDRLIEITKSVGHIHYKNNKIIGLFEQSDEYDLCVGAEIEREIIYNKDKIIVKEVK